MKILITGSSGMVGSNLSEVLSDEHQLIKNDRQMLNLENYQNILDFFNKNQPELVIHCAGYVGGILSNSLENSKYLALNSTLGLNVVRACNEVGVPKLINLSSSCMYPNNLVKPILEEDFSINNIEKTNEGYALAKIIVTKYCQYVNIESNKIKYKTLIPCNLYGPGDKYSLNKAHLIPSIIVKTLNAIQTNQNNIEIWGDGASKREFMYVVDFAETVKNLIRNFEQIPELLNVGVGYDHTVNEFYHEVARVLKYSGQFSHDLSKPSGAKRKLLNIHKISSMGCLVDRGLEHGIINTILSYQKNLTN
ncbi:MAG: NAD-dependent epimerase/dehydratase family protein [Pseudobdellovibrio sp.]